MRGQGLLEDLMVEVLEYVSEAGGDVDDEPGKLLHRIADDLEANYFAVTLAVRKLEALDMIEVERYTHPRPRQANMIVRIGLAAGWA